MGELRIPVILAFNDDHGQQLVHVVVHILCTTVAVRIVPAGGGLVSPEKLVGSLRKLREKLEAVVLSFAARVAL